MKTMTQELREIDKLITGTNNIVSILLKELHNTPSEQKVNDSRIFFKGGIKSLRKLNLNYVSFLCLKL